LISVSTREGQKRPFSASSRKERERVDTDTSTAGQGSSKVYKSADDAIADLKDGSVILSAGFGLSGVAGMLLCFVFVS
jgi:3-oxoacid CoA-transferase